MSGRVGVPGARSPGQPRAGHGQESLGIHEHRRVG